MATPTGGATPTSMPVTTSSVGPVVTSSAAPPGSNAPKGQTSGPGSSQQPVSSGPVDRDQIYEWILELASPETRGTALLELSKRREVVPELAPMLWNSFGTIAALLQEIIAIYPAINPPVLTAHQSNRVCDALALLQCVASHPETRSAFLLAHIPLYLYPFFAYCQRSRAF